MHPASTALDSPGRASPDRPLRVVSVYHHLEIGGIERLLVDILPRMDPARFAMHMACTSRAGALAPRLTERGIPVHVCRCPRRLPAGLAARRLARLLGRLGADVVHGHDPRTSELATLAGRRAGVPTVVNTVHNVGLFLEPRRLRRERRLAGLRDATLYVSGSVRRDYESRVPEAVGRGTVVYNGVDVDAFATPPRAERLAALRSELDLEGRGPVLLNVARLHRNKAHGDLVAAFAELRGTFPGAVLLIAGHGRARGEVERAIRESGHGEAIRLLGNRGDVRDLYHLADVQVLSSLKEGFSVVVLEALSAGLPQVLTDVGGNAEAIGDSEAGLIVPVRDTPAMVAALRRVLGEPAVAERMRAAATARCREFSVERQLQRTGDLYADLAARTRGVPGPA